MYNIGIKINSSLQVRKCNDDDVQSAKPYDNFQLYQLPNRIGMNI